MIKGFKGAKELSQSVDAYNDSMRSNTVINSQEIKQLKELETIWRNASNAAIEREAALNEWIRIKQAAADRELNIERSLNDALVREIQNRPNLQGITGKQIESFATIYATNPELVKKAEEFWKFSNSAEAAMGPKNVETYQRLKKELEALIPIGMTFEDAMSAARINASLNDKQINALTDSYKRLYSAQAGGAEVEAQVARWMGSLTNKEGKELEKMSDLQTQIDKQTKLLSEAIKAGDAQEIKNLGEKIRMLQEELALRERIARQTIAATITRESPISKVKRSAFPVLSTYTAPSDLAGPPTKDSGDYVPGTVILTDSGRAKQKKKSEDDAKRAQDILDKQLETRKQIVEAAAQLVYQIGQQLGLDEKTQQQLGATLDAFSQFMSGDVAGAVGSLLSSIITMMPSATERFAKEIEKINVLLKEQARLVDIASRKGGEQEAKKKEVDLAYQRYLEVKEAAEYWSDKLDKSIGGIFYGRRKSKAEEFAQLEKESLAFYEDILQEYEDLVAGGVTQNTIADSIAQGFQEGKTSVDDFADYMNNILLNAITDIFKTKTLLPLINEQLYPVITKALDNGIIDKQEADVINKTTDDLINSVAGKWKDATAGLELGTIGTPAGLSGTIRRELTEETGGELVGLIRGQRDDTRQIRDYSREGISHLAIIERNTGLTVDELKTANESLKKAVSNLDAITSNTKPVFSGSL